MGSIQLSIALLTAGISLAMGLISLFAGLHKNGEKADTVFGIMCLSLFLFFILPPQGFVLVDVAPYPTQIIIKRIFNFFFGSLFPWFIFFYTGYKEKKLPVLISSLWVVSYFMMMFTTVDSIKPMWVMFVLIPLGLSCFHGMIGVRHQFHQQQKKEGSWLLFAMVIYLILYLISAVYQINSQFTATLLRSKIFFPINLFPIAFILIMGVRLRAHSIQKYQLEKSLATKIRQWESLLNHLQLIAIHVDTDWKLRYINPHGLSILHLKEADEALGKYWFDLFRPDADLAHVKDIFKKPPVQNHELAPFKKSIHTPGGEEKIITWTGEFSFADDGAVSGILYLGTDITEQEKASEQINHLKLELEKENLVFGEEMDTSVNGEIIGTSPQIIYAIQKAKKVANTQANVLLEGETGVGKELFADLIHNASMRIEYPFIKVNCSALPAELIEDELFGHEKGSFTGAGQIRKGKFELANGGTIFLDEIGELPLTLQPKLLRVLQNGEFQRIGGHETLKIDVRIIAATNRNLETEVNEGRFRMDLFYRLNVYPITIPPLRSRQEDIPLLVQHFILSESGKHGKIFKTISKYDLTRMTEYGWPGNIRELKNVIERAVINGNNGILKFDALLEPTADKSDKTFPFSMEEVEKKHILKTLLETNWKISGERGAAEKLAMHPNTLRSRMKKFSIVRTNKKEDHS